MKIALVGSFFEKGSRISPKMQINIHIMEFSKTLEKFMYNRLISFVVNKHKSLSSEVHNGGRKMKSTATDSQIFMENTQ